MRTRKLGTQGLTVSAHGLGCMGMSVAYGAADERESIATARRPRADPTRIVHAGRRTAGW
ncbi:hypothetical protein ACIRRA_19515 [Nocardia sp. NPDC101769]|uniref:hypothetical protein n=1 Tax=Nocardia sp. NPDC101769 TaxID=3364333 RepID=UPI0038029299